MKKLLIFLLGIAAFFYSTKYAVIAQEQSVSEGAKAEVVVFVREGCTHCEAEKKYLGELSKRRDDFKVRYFDLKREEDRKVWEAFTSRVSSSKVTPITVIGKTYVIGFDAADTTGKEIETLIESANKTKIPTDLSKITKDDVAAASSTCDENGLVPCEANPTFNITLPFLGKIDAQKYPLFALSAMLGFFDGFNPCAMWVLVTFLVILVQVGDRKKMFAFAGTFILAEAIMYSFILLVWYKTWDFVRLDGIVTPIVGLVSIVGGIFFLKEWRKKELECKVTDLKQRQSTREKIKSLAADKFTFITFLSILGIAFSVNIIEFACSVGIPQAFTKILELNGLSFLQTVFFIGIYILFYMIDDFIVFGIAFYSIDKLSLTTKYSKLSNLVGGIVMLILGLMLIFKPSFMLF